jgi:hypothetical protein
VTLRPSAAAVVGLRQAFTAGVRAAGLPEPATGSAPVTEADLTPLPLAVQRYLRSMGVVGRPRDTSFRVHLAGRFRLRPGQRWMPMRAWQYNTASPPARLMLMRIRVAGVLPMVGWDTYLDGRGRMRGKLLGLVQVADGSGPEFDMGELVTWLNDAIMFAPSMLLRPHTTLRETGSDDEFDVAVSDRGRTVRARVYLEADGAPRDFSTDDRWAALKGGLVRARWTTPVSSWRLVDGRRLLASGAAIWHLPDGAYRYAEIDAVNPVAFNVTPAEAGLPGRSGPPPLHRGWPVAGRWGSDVSEHGGDR